MVELITIAKANANVSLLELSQPDPNNIEVILQENEIEDSGKHDTVRSVSDNSKNS